MGVGQKLNYFGKTVEVVEFDKTHVVIRFESGSKICTNRLMFKL
jgi:hypothetical protein